MWSTLSLPEVAAAQIDTEAAAEQEEY